MKIKYLKTIPLLLFSLLIPSCGTNINKYVGTYEVAAWGEYDAIYYFGQKKKEINQKNGDFFGQIIIESNWKATFIYNEGYHKDNVVGKVYTTSKSLRFKNCPIPYSYKFEYKENYYISGERADCLTYYSSKLTDGFIINRTEHKINCVLKKINSEN